MTSSERARVLIVGAGPTGLTLANALARYDVAYAVLERSLAPSRDSKALAISPLSQKTFELLGIRGSIGREARSVSRLDIFWRGTRLNPVDLRWLDLDCKAFLCQPQARTESELYTALGEGRRRVRWGHALVALQQAEGAVAVEVEQPDGTLVHERYDYVVGCDGKRSVVREQLGIALAGTDYPMHLVLGDFAAPAGYPADRVSYHVFDYTFIVIVPVRAGVFRITIKRDGPSDPKLPVHADEIRDVVASHLALPPLGEPLWLSRAPLYLRTASALGDRRVFIAGDAAHLYSPIGGTGMNTGIQDAINLAWKLASTVRGFARDGELLASYQSERGELIAATARATDASTRLIAGLERSPSALAPFLPRPAARSYIKHALPRQTAGIAQRYMESAAVASSNLPCVVPPGAFCASYPELLRELDLQMPGRRSELAQNLIVFFEPGAVHARRLAELREVLGPYAGCVTIWHVTDGTTDACDALAIRDEPALRRCGAVPGRMLLLRPDGVVGFVGGLGEVRALLSHIQRTLRPHAVSGLVHVQTAHGEGTAGPIMD